MIKKLPNAPKSKLKFWLLIIGLPLIPLAIFAFMLFYRGSTDDIVRVADQFKPDASWELVDETVNPPQIVCIDSVCPQVSKRWTMPSADQDSLRDALMRSKLNLVIDGDCDFRNTNGIAPVCDAEGWVDGYLISVTLWRDSTGSLDSAMTLSVKK